MTQALVDILREGKNIVFFGGAGVSTESSIPDFRSEDGLYRARKIYGYPPEQLLSYSFFMRHMDTFYRYYKENLLHPEAKPNPAHIALARLEEMGRLSAVITQNIDGLHSLAGSKNVLELHGSVLRNYCMDCGEKYPLAFILDPQNCTDSAGKEGIVPRCEKCGGVIRPDVVLYEEMLSEGVLADSTRAISRADTLIVGGTSLVVYPAAGLLQYFRGKKLVLINLEKTPYDRMAHLIIHDRVGKVLGGAVEGLSV